MKKIILLLTMILFLNLQAIADDKSEALAAFNDYVYAANTYNHSLLSMYSSNAKIIRQVIKPDNSTVNVITDMRNYSTQLKLGQAGAKMRHYKNYYSNIMATRVSNGFKITSLRQPTGETYKLKVYQIWQKQPNGNWIIVEEMMQTKEQILLKYANK